MLINSLGGSYRDAKEFSAVQPASINDLDTKELVKVLISREANKIKNKVMRLEDSNFLQKLDEDNIVDVR